MGGSGIIIVIANMQTEPGRVDVAVAPEQHSAEDGLCHDIKNAIKDGFRVWSDDVAALAQTPSDRIEEPQEDGPDTADGVRAGYLVTKRDGVLSSGPGDGPGNPEEGHRAEDEVSPLNWR